MGLVIDASSPVFTTTSAQTNTSNSFAPPDDPLLLTMWAGNDPNASSPPVGTCSSSPAQTWTADGWSAYPNPGPASVNGQAAIWHAQPVGSTGAMTVSVQNGAATLFHSIMQIFAITGHDPVAPIGASGAAAQFGGSSLSASYTATITGSQGFLVLCEWVANSTAGLTAAAGCTILNKGTLAGQISYLTLQQTNPDGVAGATTTLGVNNLVASSQLRWVYVEIVSLEARLASMRDVQGGAQVSAKHQATSW
jgi:hypothetical protein